MRQVLVSGGTSGIGLAIARALAAAGSRVTVTGSSAESLARARPGLEGLEGAVADVADQAQLSALVEGLERLDVLVNAAGMIERFGGEFTPEGFARTVDVNLNGTMRLCLLARERLAHARGCIVNLASMTSYFGSGYAPGYAASKGGVAQLTRSLAVAWAPDIRVNAIAPGWIETRLTGPLREDKERERLIRARTPMGRWGRPEEMGGLAVFLASDAASFITGAIIPVNGGYSAA